MAGKEIKMSILIVASLFATAALTIASIITLLFKEGLIEVNPKRAVVVKNLWTGEPRALLPGTHLIIPGRDKKLLEITLENEPSDPPIMKVFTGDGTEIGVDLVITTQRVLDNPEAVVRAGTAIDYKKRSEFVVERIKTYLQDAVIKYKLEDMIRDKNIDKKTLDEIEASVNQALKEKVETEWGIRVEVGIRTMELPEKAKEVAEEAATAEREGERIRIKAEKAGVDPKLIVIGDIIYDALRALKGGK